ncbi:MULTISPECIES: helix-turn-helix domain-containing protein [unclassified Streptomyces]|uniref:Helix-turn-helix domain-containing protein n=1 Tax=Streptomyces sp. NBC_00119 TaxID=2975659 RepID=A0AAU1U7G8_9ACTN|nr:MULTISPECIES: helix-turn-helix transcriptional regulator [unclassified Streptomyces]MCX4643524.1 helix-turn-helix domain-containing protein [Streptomyces sp. NBC_01446]MCX5324647.1 helix-turn-helix domain-containing protein [Streptomyces sp. NBC_00120]
MSSHASNHARVIPLHPDLRPDLRSESRPEWRPAPAEPAGPPSKEPLWRDIVGDVLRRERLAQERTLKDVADAARISLPYLSEIERGLKEASSEVLAAAAHALGLGLADVLALGRSELLRLATPTSRPAARRAPARQGEVRLAA